VNIPLLRRIVRSLLGELPGAEGYELGVHLVAEPEVVRLNEAFLHHAGSTDVIAFDHTGGQALRLSPTFTPSRLRGKRDARSTLQGEIYVCVDEAVRQSRRFRTTWQSELVRYVVHGLLHLCGYDDSRPAARRKMKRAESRLLHLLALRFPLRQLARKTRLRP